MKKILILLIAISLSACATGSKPGAMVAQLTEETIIKEDSKLRESVTIESVVGGKQTNPLWTSQVSNEEFAEALRQSFAAHAMLAAGDSVYRLDAELVKLKQPIGGFNLKVTSEVKYILTDATTRTIVFDETIVNPYTAKAGDAFLAAERLRLANEGSIKGNIEALIRLMIERVDGVVEEPMPSPTVDTEGASGTS